MPYPIAPGAGPDVEVGNLLQGKKAGLLSRAQKYAGSSAGKMAGGSLFAMWLMDKLLQTGHETGMRGIQKEGMRRQADIATPENLYYQAALPQAQQEEEMARAAMLTQLMGGVLGPQLARGERRIGG